MTISSTNRKAGPFIGNGTASVFSFSFKVFTAADLQVVKLNVATTIETTLALTTDYTVSLNTDQNANPGGSITLVAGALASGYNLVITSDIGNLQPTDLTNQGGFYPDVINDSLDRATIQIQQLQTAVDRAALLPITSSADAAALVADIERLASSANNLDIDANNIGSINTVATNIASVNTVSTNIASVNAVAANATNINAVNANATNINAVNANKTNIDTVAGNNANVSTVAGISANVTAVAGNATNINAVAGNATNINAVNANKLNIDTVAGNNSNITAVAGNSTNINAVNANSANINAVAGNATNINAVNANSANINTVAGSNTSVTTVATNITAVNSAYTNLAAIIDAPNQAAAAANSAAAAAASAASGMYSAVQDKSANYTIVAADAGDLIRVTTTSGAVTITLPLIGSTGIGDGFKIAIVKWTADANAVNIARSGTNTINGATSAQIGSQYSQIILVADLETSTWFASQSGLGATNINVDTFSGNGSTVAFTLTSDPSTKNNTSVFISGVYQQKSTYSLSGTTLTFSTAPPTGTANIEVAYSTPLAIGTPSDGTVSTVKLADGAVTYAKMQNVTAGKILGRDTSGAGAVQELPIQVDVAGNLGIYQAPIRPLTVGGGEMAITSSGANAFLNVCDSSGNNGASKYLNLRGLTSSGAGAATLLGINLDATNLYFTGSGGGTQMYPCRAWISHNSSTLGASGNISSLVRNGVGDYTINFTNAMPDVNWAPSYMGEAGRIITKTTTSFNYARILDNGTTTDGPVGIHIFR